MSVAGSGYLSNFAGNLLLSDYLINGYQTYVGMLAAGTTGTTYGAELTGYTRQAAYWQDPTNKTTALAAPITFPTTPTGQTLAWWGVFTSNPLPEGYDPRGLGAGALIAVIARTVPVDASTIIAPLALTGGPLTIPVGELVIGPV